MTFKKGQHTTTEFKKGHKHSKNSLLKMSKTLTGRKLNKQTKIKMSNFRKGKMPKNMMREGKFMNVKRGWFNINGKKMFFRSKWEVNYAFYLDWLKENKKIISWEYEPDVFVFDKIKFGTRSYKPDFKVYNLDKSIEYHEVKGWIDNRSKTKLKRMRIYHPQIKILLVDGEQYKSIKKYSTLIKGWID